MTTSIPTWLGATTGLQTNAGSVDQFLGTHAAVFIYSGSAIQAQESTGSSVYTSTASTYLAQSFNTGSGQTTMGQVALQISTVGGSPVTATITPLTVSLYAASLGLPTGSPLATATMAEQAVYGAPFWVPIVIFLTGLTPSASYMIVVEAAGSGGAYYVWQRSDQTSGALTSPDGVTWTGQPYGFMYQVYDSAGNVPPVQSIVEDNGARTTSLTYDAQMRLTGIIEQTVTQGGGSLVSSRTLSYSGNSLTGVS